MGHQFTTVTGLASGARTLNVLYDAEIQDAYVKTTGLNDPDVLGLNKLALALDALAYAKATAAGIIADPRYSDAHKTEQARAVVSQALGAAQAAAKAYGGLLDSTKALLSAKMLPKLPASADSSIVAFRAAELVKLLEASGTGTGVATTANGLLADALAQKDGVKASILTGNLLADTYQRLNVDMGFLQTLFGKTLAAAQGDASSSGGGAQLLALLSQGGPDTFYGFRDWLSSTLGSEQANYDASLSAYIAIGGVQDPRDLGPNIQQRAVPQSVTPWPAGSGRPDARQQMLRAEAMRQMRQQD